MGGNGSFSNGSTSTEEGRRLKTIYEFGGDIKIIELKNSKDPIKLPEESHSPNATYAIFNKGGKTIKAVAKYNGEGKKLFEIHTAPHKGLQPHYHNWQDGRPADVHQLDDSKQYLLNKILFLNSD